MIDQTSNVAPGGRRSATTIALVIMALLVPVAVAGRLSARVSGTEIQLNVQAVDPIDPFRGAYVELGYPDLPRSLPNTGASPDGEPAPEAENQPESTGSTLYIPLTRSGRVYVGGAAAAQAPKGLFLRCVDQWRLRCGIESYFTNQEDAAKWDDVFGAGGSVIATVRVDRWGNAALVQLAPLQ